MTSPILKTLVILCLIASAASAEAVSTVAPHRQCKKDSDCVIMPSTCGGFYAINKKFKKQQQTYNDKYKDEMSCNPPSEEEAARWKEHPLTAICVDKVCDTQEEGTHD